MIGAPLASPPSGGAGRRCAAAARAGATTRGRRGSTTGRRSSSTRRTLRAASLVWTALGIAVSMLDAAAQDAPMRGGWFTDDRAVEVSFGPMMTSHVGAYDRYIAPELISAWRRLWGGGDGGGGSGSSGGGGFNASTLFPDGRIPKNLRYRYSGSTGFDLSVGVRTALSIAGHRRPVRIAAHVMAGDNGLDFFAPHGIGVFIDPTKLYARASFFGVAGEISTPVLEWGAGGGNRLWLGGGAIAYRSFTRLDVTSAFLDLHERDVQNRLEPLVSVKFESDAFRKLLHGPLGTSDLSIEAVGFRTQYLWTVGLKASISARF